MNLIANPSQRGIDRVRAALGLRHFEAARREALEVLATEPENCLAHLLLGQSQALLGQFDEARRAAEEAIRLAPDWGWGHWLVGWSLLVECERQLKNPGNPARFHLARRAAEQAVAAGPLEPQFHWLAAAIAYHLGHHDEALRGIRDGLTAAPDHAGLHSLQGLVKNAGGDAAAAIAPLEEALRLDPEDAVAHRELAKALFKKGRYRLARGEIREALRLNPQDAHSRELMLKIIQTQHWLVRGTIWLNQVTAPVRRLFPFWIFGVIVAGLPVILWIDSEFPSGWQLSAAIALWLNIAALPLISLLLTPLGNVLWAALGRDARAYGLSWQELWDRTSPSLVAVTFPCAVGLAIWLQSMLVMQYYFTCLAVGAIQRSAAAVRNAPVRRALFGAAAVYAVAVPCLLIHRLAWVDWLAGIEPFLVNLVAVAFGLGLRAVLRNEA